MKKHLLGLALASTFGLVGCGGGDGPAEPKIPDGTGGQGGTALTIVEFETTDSNGDGYLIPLPNDLLFLGTTDLTLNISGVVDADIGGANGTKSIQAQLNKLDGWSATAPFVVKTRNNDGASLNATTLAAGVRIFKVTLLRPGAVNPNAPVSATNPKVPTGPVTGIEAELVQGTDYSVSLAADDASGRTLRISPLKPLSPQSSYMVVLTNAIKDSNGNGIAPDSTYAVAAQTTPLPDGHAAKQLQQLTDTHLQAAAGAGIARDTVAASYVFTVQSVNETLNAVYGFINNAIPGVTNPIPPTVTMTGATTIPGSSFGLPANLATFYQGRLTLPFFLKASTNADTNSSVGTAGGLVSNATSNDPTVIRTNWNAPATVDLGGGPMPNPLGTNLTYANPLPAPTGAETIPLLVSYPGPGCTKPASGFPVVIFQHGITGNRTNMIPLAATLAAPGVCHVTVAIDQPMHGLLAASEYTDPTSQGLANAFFAGHSTADANGGLRERLMGLDLMNNTTGALGVPDGKVDTSGSWFINLQYLLVTRDNLREAAADLLSLSRALKNPALDLDGVANGADIDPAKMSFAGQSLGSIVGITFAGTDASIKTAMLSVPGGAVAKLLDGSMAFGPRIRAGLAGNGIVAGTAAYEQFLWSAQTMVDAGDPINTGARLIARNIPVLLHEVVGTPGVAPSDLVVPNAVIAGTYTNPITQSAYSVYASGPLAGTEPLIRTFGLTQISADTLQTTDAKLKVAVKFTRGEHSSLLTCNTTTPPLLDPSCAVRTEMQQQAATFIASMGMSVPATEGSGAVQPAP